VLPYGKSEEFDLSSAETGTPEGRTKEMYCKKCGTSMRRLSRRGFLQEKIYSLFGYYPWECPLCRKPVMLKKQYQRRTRRTQENSAD
jgi:hypothetical protein